MSAGIVTEVFVETVILKMDVSHSRNLDQVSLVFQKTVVGLVTNVFQIDPQEANQPSRLGQFEISMTPELENFKSMLRSHYRVLTNNNITQNHVPHASTFHLNGQRVDHNYLHFSHLESIFSRVRKREWTYVRCAEYERRGRSIIRIVKNRGQRERRRDF